MRRFRDNIAEAHAVLARKRASNDGYRVALHLIASRSLVKLMSRRNAPGPNFEIVPRDRPVTRQRMQARDELLEAQQLGPRLQRIYSPCTDQQPDDMRMLIVALDRKLHAR